MGNEAVRLRRATMYDYDFCKILWDDISCEILYGNNKAFGLPEIEYDNKDEDLVLEFDEPQLTKEFFEKSLTVWRHKIYIIEFTFDKTVIPIGYFHLAKTGKGEPNRLQSWTMLPSYFDKKEEALRLLLSRKELVNKKVTVNIFKTDCEFNWLVEKFGFREDETVLSTLSLN